jgi:hypothetical protein
MRARSLRALTTGRSLTDLGNSTCQHSQEPRLGIAGCGYSCDDAALRHQAACGCRWAEEGRRYRRAQRLRPTALVEAGGMVERGRLEALRECMMSGVTVPPWRSRVYLTSRKIRNKSIASFRACTRQVRYTPSCRHIAAAQRTAASGHQRT